MRRRSIDPLVNLLSNRGVQTAVAFGETAYAQPAGKTGERARGDTRDVQLGCRAPTNAAGCNRVIVAAEMPRGSCLAKMRSIPVCRSRCVPKLRTCGRKSGAGRSCASTTGVQAPVASSRLNTVVVPVRSQVEAISRDTGLGRRAPVSSVAKLTSLSAEMARLRGRPLGIRSSKE